MLVTGYSMCPTGYSNVCRALADRSRVALEVVEAVVVAVVATLVVAVVAATAARAATVVVEDTSKVVEEVTVDRVVMAVVVDTSRVDMVVDTENCNIAALAPSACWVSRSFALLDCFTCLHLVQQFPVC